MASRGKKGSIKKNRNKKNKSSAATSVSPQSDQNDASPSPLSPPRRKPTGKRDAEPAVPDLTPSRAHASSRIKLSDGKGIIKKIAVADVTSVRGKDHFTASYIITFENCTKDRIKVGLGKTEWDDDNTAVAMMIKTRSILTNKLEELNLCLDDVNGVVLMNTEWPWLLLWDSVQNKVNELKIEGIENTNRTKMGHDTRDYSLVAKDWEGGEEFNTPANLYTAKRAVLNELEKRSGKEIMKAVSILSSILTNLVERGLNELDILSKDTKEKFNVLGSMIDNAIQAIRGLKKNCNKHNARVLTGFCAIMAPASNDNELSMRRFCDLFELGRQSKYVELGLANRKMYNEYLSKTDSPLVVGDRVSCKGSNDGTIIIIGNDCGVTVQLHPMETVKTYGSLRKGNVVRWQPVLDDYLRVKRCDVTPDVDKQIMSLFFRRNNQVSPNKKDVIKIRHPDFPTMFQVVSILYYFTTMSEQWVQFGKEHEDLYEKYKYEKQPHTAPRVFRESTPLEMRKGKDVGCLCIKCEGFQGLLRGATEARSKLKNIIEQMKAHDLDPTIANAIPLLRNIEDILSSPSKYDIIKACLYPCVQPDDKLECAKHSCIYSNCDECGFRQLWSNKLVEILKDANSPIQKCKEWAEEIKSWQYSQKLDPVESHSRTTARQAASARAASRTTTDDDDEEYKDKGAARNLVLDPTQGSLIEYLIRFEKVVQDNTIHRHIVATAAVGKIQYEQNIRPLVVAKGMDFSENGTIKDKRQVQSQYWVTISYTLFMSVVIWLLASEWNKECGELSEGDEVTVHGEKTGEPINKDSFWAIVTQVINAESDKYILKDNNGNKYQVGNNERIKRSDLRHRVRYKICIGHISDDKTHDSQAMQHFTSKELKWLEGHMVAKFPEDIPGGKIVRYHTKSDNAASHFKSTRSMNYYTTLSEDRGGVSSTAYEYSFGAPSHGKEEFDGYGGTLKGKVDQSCSSAYSEGTLEYTKSGYVTNVEDVYDTLVYHFEEAQNRDRRQGKNSIDEYKFFLSSESNGSPVQRPDMSYRTMTGISDHYQFVSRSLGVQFIRHRQCWCVACTADIINGTSGWVNNTHIVPGCKMSSISNDDTAAEDTSAEESTNNDQSTTADKGNTTTTPDLYTFYRAKCEQVSGHNMNVQRQEDRRSLQTMSLELTIGSWVCLDSNEEEQPIWLGRVMSNPDWNGEGIKHNTTNRTVKYSSDYGEDIEIGPGEVAVYIIWYERIDVSSDSYDYHISRDITVPEVQSNYYLVHGGFDMHCTTKGIGSNGNPVPKERSATRNRNRNRAATLGDYAVPRQNHQKTFDDWHTVEYGLVWKMDDAVRELALSRIGRKE